MPLKKTPTSEKLGLLVDAARSQKQVARLACVSDGTLINWREGLGIRESKINEVADNLGVSREWLRDGVGDDARELAAFRAKLGHSDVGGARGLLATLLRRRQMTPAQLAKAIGYDAGVIEYVVNGTARASEEMIERIVRVLPELSKDELMTGSEETSMIAEGIPNTYGAKPRVELPPGMRGRMVPLLSSAQAGGWDAGHSDEGWHGESVFALNVDDRKAFAIRVAGNSMEPEIREGDIVVCSPARPVTQGCCAVVRTRSDQAFIKFWKKRGDMVVLESANPDYKPLHFPETEIAGAWPVIQRISTGLITKES